VLERLARQTSRDWILPGVLALALAGVHLAGPDAMHALRYERTAILAGEPWRLVTGHLVHFDLAHLGWNLVGVMLVWILFAREFTWRGWLIVLFASTAAIDLGFLAFEPDLEWYVGFSGVLHGCMAAGLVAWLRSGWHAPTVLVAAIFVGKLLWEQLSGPLPFTAGTMSLPVIHAAHSYGAVGGALAAICLRGCGGGRGRPL